MRRTKGQDVTINAKSRNAFFFLAVEIPPRVENMGIVSPDFRDTEGRRNIAVNTENGTRRQLKVTCRLYAQTDAMTLWPLLTGISEMS